MSDTVIINKKKKKKKEEGKIEEEWCWRTDSAETSNGPYDSQEEAIEAAKEECQEQGPGVTILVGRIEYITPGDYLARAFDIDDLMERMEELLHDDGYWFEDNVFELLKKRKEDGLHKLEAFLKSWGNKYMNTNNWVAKDEKEVKLS